MIRSGQDGDTVFANPYFDVTNDNTGTKHVFAGALRVASVLRAYSGGSDPPPPPSSGTAFYFHADHLGSTGVVTAQDGTVNDAHAYFPDGEIWIDAGPKQPINGYLFSGKQLDVETGFYDFGQRFYDPRLSLWLGTDPILLDDSPDRAIGQPLLLAPGAYAAHNPLGFIDPDGRDPKEVPLGDNNCFGQSCQRLYAQSQGNLVLLNVGRDGLKFMEGVPKGVRKTAEGTAHAIVHPKDTAEAVGAGIERAWDDPWGTARAIGTAIAETATDPGKAGELVGGLLLGGGTAKGVSTGVKALRGLGAATGPTRFGPRSLGAAEAAIPKFTRAMKSQAKIIARGSGIQKVEELVSKFGGQATNWKKMKTWDGLGREIHWYEHPGIGKVGIKWAGFPDPF